MRAEMTLRLWLVVLAFLVGCSGSAPTCGPGTLAKDGKCVTSATAVVCGSGTILDKGVCVLGDAGGDSAGSLDALSDTGALDTVAIDTLPIDTGGDGPNGGCGAGCPKGQTCSPEGACVAIVTPKGWLCAPTAFSDGEVCDCACGVIDPDCVNPTLPVVHCSSGQCAPDGTCAECLPACNGKTCGPDGCGSECGQCLSPDAPFCQGGQCKASCGPQCVGKVCGPDGCGGSCGTCAQGEACTFGQCGEIAPEDSCLGHCGGKAASGCGCDAGCTAGGTCCVDFTATCGCVPACQGNTCGEDGCGGLCGTCAVGEVCVDGTCDTDPCDPDPCATHGTCAAATGACTCQQGFAGVGCDQCAAGYTGYPDCVADLCTGPGKSCSQHGSCVAATGACECDAGFTGPACGACATGQGTWPNCTDPCASQPNCDDGNACTQDSCSKTAGCVHAPTVIGCDDGNACTLGDLCVSGVCTGGGKVCDYAVNAMDDVDDGSCDAKHCSLREAIVAANAGQVAAGIGLSVVGPITLAAELPTLVVPLSVIALGQAVTLDGGGKVRIFHAQANLTLSNVILQAGAGGAQGGGVWQESGNVTLQGVQIRACTATQGAGLYAAAGAKVSDSTFADNVGGAVFADAGLDVTRTLFTNNTTSGAGGGVACSVSCVTTIARSTFVGNGAATGGGLYVQGSANVSNSAFLSNTASLNGGGVAASGKVTIVHGTFFANLSPNVSGILVTGSLDLRNSLVGGSVSGGADCAATVLLGTLKNLVEDGSCNAALQGPAGPGDMAWCQGLFSFVPAFGSAAIDAGDKGACAAAGAVDLCGKARPQGAGCDLGAVEVAP